jgi:DNA-directed RNA polymerase subunit RPC12/RpoP
MDMWTKYDYVCSDCDALIEITTLDDIRDWRGWCPCGSANIINISVRDGNAPVIDITPNQVVKINSNPYN